MSATLERGGRARAADIAVHADAVAADARAMQDAATNQQVAHLAWLVERLAAWTVELARMNTH